MNGRLCDWSTESCLKVEFNERRHFQPLAMRLTNDILPACHHSDERHSNYNGHFLHVTSD